MTCVVAVADEQRVVLAADSAGAGFTPTPEIYGVDVPKVFRAEPWVVGYAANWRFGQILRHHVEWPQPEPGGDLIAFGVTEIVPRIRRALKEQGFLRTYEDGRERGAQTVAARGNFLFEATGPLPPIP